MNETEIERKFYVDISKLSLEDYQRTGISQKYIKVNDRAELRLRLEMPEPESREPIFEITEDTRAYITQKIGRGEVRDERSIELDLDLAHYLWNVEFASIIPLEKMRYYLYYNDKIIELDIFINIDHPPVAEIEFNTVDEMDSFNCPAWFKEKCSKSNADICNENFAVK